MKILLAYATKSGTTRECVRRLAAELHQIPTETVCLNNGCPDLSQYDLIVAGGPVRFGKLHPAVRQFLTGQEALLRQKPLGLFLCCGLAHEYEYYCEHLLPKTLREHAFLTTDFGGSLRTDTKNPLERLLLHFIRSTIAESELEDGEYTPSLPGILPENIGKMATYLRNEVAKLE